MTDAERDALKEFIVGVIGVEVRRAVAQIDLEALRGKDGTPGRNGQDGLNGVDGKDGAPGVNGKDGAPGPEGMKGLDGKDGKDGKDGIDGVHGKDGVPGPVGEKGLDGKDADPELIRSEVAKAVAALPVAKDGKDGVDGKDVDLLVVRALVAGEVADRVAALPSPKDGRDGKDGITAEQLDNGIIKGLAAALGELHLDGRDLKIGDRLIARIPFPEDQGVYQADTDYEKGDIVSFGGSGWVANKATRDKPGTSDAWRLMIKKGRDGKDGRDGRDTPPRPPVKQ